MPWIYKGAKRITGLSLNERKYSMVQNTTTEMDLNECVYMKVQSTKRITELDLNEYRYMKVQSTINICRNAPTQDIKGAEHRNIIAKKISITVLA